MCQVSSIGPSGPTSSPFSASFCPGIASTGSLASWLLLMFGQWENGGKEKNEVKVFISLVLPCGVKVTVNSLYFLTKLAQEPCLSRSHALLPPLAPPGLAAVSAPYCCSSCSKHSLLLVSLDLPFLNGPPFKHSSDYTFQCASFSD